MLAFFIRKFFLLKKLAQEVNLTLNIIQFLCKGKVEGHNKVLWRIFVIFCYIV
ncbi:MAG: hypothetical protein JG777_2154 [Clostridia bacterium]|jgi:hypothetical protein|nr:hypothetical protein [Clostridia bacterium]